MRFLKAAIIMILILSCALFTFYSPAQYAFAVSADTGYDAEDKSLLTGIVKENNPSLGYLTLYFEDGSGSNPESFDKLVSLRNFTYGYEIPVIRDGYTVTAEAIKPGDQVFLKLDKDGYIGTLSARSCYKPVYGTVHIKSAGWLVLKNENGTYASYPLSSAIPIFKNGRSCTVSDILPGDRVRILVQTDNNNLDIASIDIEKLTKPVSGIYRGICEYFDKMRDTMAVSGVQEFINGRWENTSTIGIQNFNFSSEFKTRPAARLWGTVYFAVQKTVDGSNKIVAAAYRAVPQYETTVRDNVFNMDGSGLIELENTSETIRFDQNTIAVKDGRLVDPSALDTFDPVMISMEKPISGGSFTAHVLVSSTVALNTPVVYRGRIKSVDPHKTVTLESFARLSGVAWTFTNTPKTFDIDLASSRLIDVSGIGNMRDLSSGHIGRSVYIIASGSKIRLISTAPYADSPVSGRVESLTGGTKGSDGSVLTDPTGLVLKDAMTYNTSAHKWSGSVPLTISIPAGAVVIKDGEVGTASLIDPGDDIKIIRHSQSLSGVLILCE